MAAGTSGARTPWPCLLAVALAGPRQIIPRALLGTAPEA